VQPASRLLPHHSTYDAPGVAAVSVYTFITAWSEVLFASVLTSSAMPDAETAVNWTMVGICAHESALRGGERVPEPRF
jgi:ABC-type glycerol-3-phosphate transport system permease component